MNKPTPAQRALLIGCGVLGALGLVLLAGVVGIFFFIRQQVQSVRQTARDASTEVGEVAELLGDVFGNDSNAANEQYQAELARLRAESATWDDARWRALLEAKIFGPEDAEAELYGDDLLRENIERTQPILLAMLADPALRPKFDVPVSRVEEETGTPIIELDLALGYLIWTRDPSLVASLTPYLDSTSPTVRAAAARGLAQQGSVEALGLVERALADEDGTVRVAALEGLALVAPEDLGDAAAREHLLTVLLHNADEGLDTGHIPAVAYPLDKRRVTDYYLARSYGDDLASVEMEAILEAWRDDNALVPHDFLQPLFQKLVPNQGKGWPSCCSLGHAARLVGMHRRTDDLALLVQAAQKPNICWHPGAVEGLFSYHGYHNLRDRLRERGQTEDVTSWPARQQQVYHILKLFDCEDGFRECLITENGPDLLVAVEGLKAARAAEHARIVQSVIDLFGRAGPSANPEIFATQLDELTTYFDPFVKPDQEWQETNEPLWPLLVDYVVQHPEDFADYRLDATAEAGDTESGS